MMFALGVLLGVLLCPLCIVMAGDLALARAERRLQAEDER